MGAFDDLIPSSSGSDDSYRTNFSGTPTQVADAKRIAAADYAKVGAFDDLIPRRAASPGMRPERTLGTYGPSQSKPEPPPERAYGPFGNALGAVVEPIASMATGVVAKPASELVGLGALPLHAMGVTQTDPLELQQSLQRKMTYEPKTAAGQVVNEYNPIALLAKALGWTADKVATTIAPEGSNSGREAVGNFVREGIMQAPGILGAKMATGPAGPGARLTPALEELSKRKIPVTPGQLVPALDKIEQGVAKWPIVGAPVRAARGRGVEEFNRSFVQDALTPIGKELPKDLVGSKAIAFAQNELDAAYNDLLPSMRGNLGKPELEAARGPTGPGPMPPRPPGGEAEFIPADKGAPSTAVARPRAKALPPPAKGEMVSTEAPAAAGAEAAAQPGAAPALGGPPRTATLWDELETLKKNGESLPPNLSAELNRIIDREVIAKFNEGPPGSPQGTGTGAASGETIKGIQSELRQLAESKGRSENYDVRQQGQALKEAGAALRRMIERENPEYATQLSAINDAYANFKIAQRAAANPGAREGVATPSQFNRAVRDKDPSKDKSAYAKGTARQQPLANAAREVLADTLPDSGTATQLAIMRMFLGDIGKSKAGVFGIPGGIAANMALQPFYSPAGLALLQRMLLHPPPIGQGVGAAMMAAPRGQPPER